MLPMKARFMPARFMACRSRTTPSSDMLPEIQYQYIPVCTVSGGVAKSRASSSVEVQAPVMAIAAVRAAAARSLFISMAVLSCKDKYTDSARHIQYGRAAASAEVSKELSSRSNCPASADGNICMRRSKAATPRKELRLLACAGCAFATWRSLRRGSRG